MEPLLRTLVPFFSIHLMSLGCCESPAALLMACGGCFLQTSCIFWIVSSTVFFAISAVPAVSLVIAIIVRNPRLRLSDNHV